VTQTERSVHSVIILYYARWQHSTATQQIQRYKEYLKVKKFEKYKNQNNKKRKYNKTVKITHVKYNSKYW